MDGFERDRPASGERIPDLLNPLGRDPLQRPHHPTRSHHPAGRRLPPEPPHAPPPAWWPGVRRGLPSLAVALLLVALGAALLNWRGAVTASTNAALVVWRTPGQDAVTLSSVDRADWQAFLASRRESRAKTRHQILTQARAETLTALAPLFDEMKGRVKDYIGWFYFFPTTYRMAFTSVIAMLSKDKSDPRAIEQVATESLNRLLQDRFLEVVVVPEKFGPATEALERTVMKRAISRAEAAAAGETAALTAFMTAHGKPASAAAGQTVTVSWEALGLPAPASAMSAPPDAVALIKADPALSGLQTTATTEGMMLVARQFARRMIHSAVGEAARTMVTPMIAGSALGPAEALLSPLLGFAAFGVGVGAEFGTVKLRETVESQRLTDLSNGIVDHVRETQSALLADGVTHRVETWIGE